MQYTYDYFLKNRETDLRTLLQIQGECSDFPVSKLFGENWTANETRTYRSLIRGANSVMGCETINDVLNKTFANIMQYRHMGKGSQIVFLTALLKFFNLSDLTSASEVKESNKSELIGVIHDSGETELREMLLSVFDELTFSQQQHLLNKFKEWKKAKCNMA